MFAHLGDAMTDRLHITQISQCGLPKSHNQPSLHGLIGQAPEPRIEFRQCSDGIHGIDCNRSITPLATDKPTPAALNSARF
jgi:hypothetical protein